jgi:hypothetical protein
MKAFYLTVVLSSVSIFNLFSEEEEKKEEKNYATPVQISFFAPVQLAPIDSDVYGLRLALPYGRNNKLFGLDVGIWNQTNGNSYGIQVAGLVASRKGRTCGLNVGGLVNLSEGKEYGISIAGLYNQADGHITGLHLGVVTKAKKATGLQLGLINYCDDLTGVQLGLINICSSSSIPFMLLINAKY